MTGLIYKALCGLEHGYLNSPLSLGNLKGIIRPIGMLLVGEHRSYLYGTDGEEYCLL